MSEEEIKIIKSIIYNDQGKKMSYVDVNYAEGENFINAVDKLLVEYKQQQKEIENLKEYKHMYENLCK